MAKKQGHYCKICGMYQSNESFSGKGHNAHICKKCAALTPEERSREATLTRLLNLPYRLSAEQKAWLKGLQKDKCQEISETAKAVYAEHYLYALFVLLNSFALQVVSGEVSDDMNAEERVFNMAFHAIKAEMKKEKPEETYGIQNEGKDDGECRE